MVEKNEENATVIKLLYELKSLVEDVPNAKYYRNKDLKRISPDTHMFFDWIYVIENAKEIHCMDSSYLCLIDCLNLNKDIELFNHRYIRGYPDFIKVATNKEWNFIK